MKITKIILFLLFITSVSIIYAEENGDKAVFELKCSYCHGLDRPLSRKKSQEDWKATVKRMRDKNPGHINEEEASKIFKYLISTQLEPKIVINKIKDINNPTELEKKHAPVVVVDWKDMSKGDVVITVEIGQTFHPMEKDHYIKSIELFIGNKSFKKIILNPGDKPSFEFKAKIRGGEHIVARSECNMHGIWEGGIR